MRRTGGLAFWYGQQQFDRMYVNMSNRQGHERKLGHITLQNLIHNESQNKREEDPPRNASVLAVNIQAAANEHGTSQRKLDHDLARQRVHLDKEMLRTLAHFEPMSFRALVELAGSGIAPPPRLDPAALKAPMTTAPLPGEAPPATAARADLEYDVRRMLRRAASPAVSPDPEVKAAAADLKKGTDAWMGSWREFCAEDEIASPLGTATQ